MQLTMAMLTRRISIATIKKRIFFVLAPCMQSIPESLAFHPSGEAAISQAQPPF